MQIKSLFRNYNLHFQNFNFNKINNKDIYIIDKNVHNLYFRNFNIKKKIIILSNETSKSFEKISYILKKFLYYRVNRKTKINVIGGGVVQDISSFSCSIYLRGLKWIFTQPHFWHKQITQLDQKPLLISIEQKIL